MQFSFEIGESEKHTISVELSAFGRESYRVDGEVVLQGWYFGLRGRRTFSVGERERHVIEFVYDALPSWKELFVPGGWRAEVYVDGELHIEDLTSKWRRRVRGIDHAFNLILLGIVLFALAGGAAYLIRWLLSLI